MWDSGGYVLLCFQHQHPIFVAIAVFTRRRGQGITNSSVPSVPSKGTTKLKKK